MRDAPFLQVVRGHPSDAELAALVVVLAARAAVAAGPPRQRSAWGDPRARVRHPLYPGPGAWRRSGLPA